MWHPPAHLAWIWQVAQRNPRIVGWRIIVPFDVELQRCLNTAHFQQLFNFVANTLFVISHNFWNMYVCIMEWWTTTNMQEVTSHDNTFSHTFLGRKQRREKKKMCMQQLCINFNRKQQKICIQSCVLVVHLKCGRVVVTFLKLSLTTVFGRDLSDFANQQKKVRDLCGCAWDLWLKGLFLAVCRFWADNYRLKSCIIG